MHLSRALLATLLLFSFVSQTAWARAEVVRAGSATGSSSGKSHSGQSASADVDRSKIGQVASPFPACETLNLVDSDLLKKNETQWRQLSMRSDFGGPIEAVPSTSMFKSFNASSALKPGSQTPTQFLENVGQRAIYDLNSGLQQYRDLKQCVQQQDASVLCTKLREGFRRGFDINGPLLRAALARSSHVEPLYVSRAVAMNDSSDFVNSRMEIGKAGVFGVSSHKPLSSEELSSARADIRREFDKAKKEYLEMVETRLSERQRQESWPKETVDRERLRMTSPQALTAAVGMRMSEFRLARVSDYYRAMTASPQLAYSTSMPKSDSDLSKVIDKMIQDGEQQLKKTNEVLAAAKKASQNGSSQKLSDHHLKLAAYSSTMQKVLAEEALRPNSGGRPQHCGLAVGLHNELLSSQAVDGLLVAGALITAPIGAAIAVPRLAMAVGASSFAAGTGVSSIVVGTGISSGLISAGRDIAHARSALNEVRTGVRAAEDARASVSAANLAAIGVATSAAVMLKPTLQAAGKVVSSGRQAQAVSAGLAKNSRPVFPAPIKETVGQSIHGKVMDVPRLRSAMKLIKAKSDGTSASLTNLDDGIYIYGIDKKGNTAIIPRNLDPGGEIGSNSTFIGSHLGLRAAMKDALGEEIEFVAAGEIVQRNGRTMMVSNGAGSFKNGSENLSFGVEQMKQKGLKVDPRTEIRDYSKDTFLDPHDVVSVQVPKEIQVARDPALRDLHRETSGLVARVDAKGVATEDEFFTRALALDGVDSTAAYHATVLIRRWQNPAEGTAYSFEGLYSHIGPEKYQEALKVIRRVGESQSP